MATPKNILATLLKRNEGEISGQPQTTIQQYKEILKHINSLMYITGIEFTNEWKFNLRAKCHFVMNCLLVWSELYTLCVLFPSINCVELTSGILHSITVITKFVFFVQYHDKFMSVVEFIFELANKNGEGKRKEILSDLTKTIFYHFKLIFSGFACGAILYILNPVWDYLVNGHLGPVSPLLFPFARDDTVKNYLITTICNIIPPSWNICGIIGISCLFMLFVDVYAGLILLIHNDLNEFDDMCTQNHDDINLRNVLFRNTLTEIMDLARLGIKMNELFSLITTVQIGCCFLGISTALFGYLANDYFGGMGASAYFVAELTLFCYIGQLMDDQITKIQMTIFDSNWYVYDNRYQQELMFTLGIVQKFKSIAVAGVLPLNFQTGLLVTKNIYSILMFLLNALD